MKKNFTCFLIFFALYFSVKAQSVEEQMTQKTISCKDVLINASNVLPNLYKQNSFDSMRIAIAVIKQYCDSGYAVFYAEILLHIQQSSFSITDFPDNGRFDTLFDAYTFTEKSIHYGGYEINKYNYYTYTKSEKSFYLFIQNWAKDLLASQKLSKDETFICNVFAGNIKRPQAFVKSHRKEYPDLYDLLYKNYAAEREASTGNIAFISGVWIPSGNLKILGVHPTFGWQIGGRTKHNEFDLTMDFRFGNTPANYYVLRNDSLYGLNHFFGGYIGFDYTRYFFHSTSFEFGAIGGVGYDGYDIAEESSSDHSKDYLKPFEIESLNLNAGLRFNYFFNPHFYIGLQAKYNGINYINKGGTNLSGNPVSLDLCIGR